MKKSVAQIEAYADWLIALGTDEEMGAEATPDELLAKFDEYVGGGDYSHREQKAIQAEYDRLYAAVVV